MSYKVWQGKDINEILSPVWSVILDGYRNWNVYNARSTRKEFWLWSFHAWLFVVALTPFENTNAVFLMLFPIVPSIAMWVRRIHDTGHRIWWCLIPGFGGIINVVLLLTKTNQIEKRWVRPGEARPTKD
jgi:uncharacterized membrane protein YhaH (DUF805 family)